MSQSQPGKEERLTTLSGRVCQRSPCTRSWLHGRGKGSRVYLEHRVEGTVRPEVGLEDSSQMMNGFASSGVRTASWGRWRILEGFMSGEWRRIVFQTALSDCREWLSRSREMGYRSPWQSNGEMVEPRLGCQRDVFRFMRDFHREVYITRRIDRMDTEGWVGIKIESRFQV